MTDRRTIFLVTLFLGLIVLGGLGSVVALTLAGEVVPETIGLVTTAALGSLASLLVSTKVDPGQLPDARADSGSAVTLSQTSSPASRAIKARTAGKPSGKERA